MNYEQVQGVLLQYAQHNQKGFTNYMFTKTPFALAFPTLKGASGIGKTASVERFAKEQKLLLMKWDAEGMGLAELCTTLSSFTEQFKKAKEEGAVFLIERFDMLDGESIAFLKDYVQGEATATVKTGNKGMVEITVKRTPNLNLVAEVTT